MGYLLKLVIIALLYCGCTVNGKKCEGKGKGGIIGGHKATRGQLPWQIYLVNNDFGGQCGGSIISPRHILTAGHCIENSAQDGKAKPSSLDLYAGVLNIQDLNNKDVQKVPVKAITVNSKWDSSNSLYELTILTLQTNLTWTDTVQQIRYGNKDDKTDLAGEKVIASGWGTMDHYGADGTQSMDLLWTEMIVAKCDFNYHAEDLFCARGANGENVCSGDSGGPIVCKDAAGKDYLCGYSSGSLCEKGQSQLGRVNYYADFIKKTLKT